MTESINEIERARAKARMLTGKSLDPSATLPQGSKGKTSEKVSRKIGMKPRTYDKAKKIWARAKVRQIRKPKSVVPTLAPQVKGDNIVPTLARSDKGKSLDPVPTLAQGKDKNGDPVFGGANIGTTDKGKSREKVSKKIGMKPRINTFADRIVLTESVKLIKD